MDEERCHWCGTRRCSDCGDFLCVGDHTGCEREED